MKVKTLPAAEHDPGTESAFALGTVIVGPLQMQSAQRAFEGLPMTAIMLAGASLANMSQFVEVTGHGIFHQFLDRAAGFGTHWSTLA